MRNGSIVNATHRPKPIRLMNFIIDGLTRVMMQSERWHAGKTDFDKPACFFVQVNQPVIWKGSVFCRYDASRIMGSQVTRGNWRSNKKSSEKQIQTLLFWVRVQSLILRVVKKMAKQYGPRPSNWPRFLKLMDFSTAETEAAIRPSAFSRYVFVAGWVPVVSVMAVAMFFRRALTTTWVSKRLCMWELSPTTRHALMC